jgi:hypothetical protein
LPYEGELRSNDCGAIEIKTLCLDELVGTGQIRAPRVVKMDVAGHGHKALEGMRQMLQANRPVLLVAFRSPQKVDGILGLLEGLRYESKAIGTEVRDEAGMVGKDYLFVPT